MFDFKRNQFLQALLLVAIVWLVLKLTAIIIVFFIALLFILVLHPVVDWLRHRHVPTVFAVLAPVIGIFALLALLGFFAVPTFVDQVSQFAHKAPDYVNKLQHSSLLAHSKLHLDTKSVTKFAQNHSGSLSNALISLTTKFLELVTGVITIFIVTLIGTGTYERSRQTLFTYVPRRHRKRAVDIWSRIERKIVTWVGAQLLLSAVVGIMVWIGSALLGLPFPGLLGLISGFLELVPTLGPIAATIPGFLLGLTISVKVAVFAIVLHLVVAQIEAHLLAPWLLGRTVRLHPIVIIFSLLTGTVLYGILGTLLAVPSALIISAVVDSFRGEAKLEHANRLGKELAEAAKALK